MKAPTDQLGLHEAALLLVGKALKNAIRAMQAAVMAAVISASC